ncbi:MAG TPA: hypothetical protein VNH46_14040, partial [Gemmatimonadales bacterium]|nr:hypothetical protein [Gemmatimonadales bacterium]
FQYLADHNRVFEVDWALVMVEPDGPGPEAGILVTKLHADAMPMIRYANDDVGRFPAGSSPGKPVYCLEEVLGRRADRILLPSGSWLHGLHFPHLFKDFPIREFQVAQKRDFSVVVRIVPTAEFGPSHRAALAANLAANLPGVAFAVETVDAIPRTRANKWRPVVSELAS